MAINWKSYKKDAKIEELKEDFFTEQVIDFEEGWPWNFITRDPAYPDAFEWKLNRGYTNSVGTGPKSDRTTQSVGDCIFVSEKTSLLVKISLFFSIEI